MNWLFGFFRLPHELSRRSALLSLNASNSVLPEHGRGTALYAGMSLNSYRTVRPCYVTEITIWANY